MESLSGSYGWTPDQIRAMRADDVEAYMEIARARAAVEKADNIKRYGSRH